MSQNIFHQKDIHSSHYRFEIPSMPDVPGDILLVTCQNPDYKKNPPTAWFLTFQEAFQRNVITSQMEWDNIMFMLQSVPQVWLPKKRDFAIAMGKLMGFLNTTQRAIIDASDSAVEMGIQFAPEDTVVP